MSDTNDRRQDALAPVAWRDLVRAARLKAKSDYTHTVRPRVERGRRSLGRLLIAAGRKLDPR